MTKNLTDGQITGYKRDRFFEKVNNKKNNHNTNKMKFFAAALLAIGATAISLQVEKMPFPAPKKCPDKPTLEDLKAATPEQVFE